MKIGNVNIDGFAALAPMAGVADSSFRQICVDYGACYVVGEMVSSKGLTYGDKKSHTLLKLSDNERPAAIQLFGEDAYTIAKAAQLAMQYNPDIIDINMGCPAQKIASNKSGCALMKDVRLCGDITKAVVDAVDVPVTVKIRKGYSLKNVNAVEVAKECEQNGASAITVHGRTKEQMYRPVADWDIIKQVKEAVSIPVIGNGDVTDALSAAALYEQTDCDLVMVGRAALGSPWIFSQIQAYLKYDKILPDPPLSTKLSVLMKQAKMTVQEKGEKIGMLQMRKHASWYMKGLDGAATLRKEANQISTISDLEVLCTKILNNI